MGASQTRSVAPMVSDPFCFSRASCIQQMQLLSNVTLKPAGFALLSQLRADADKEARQHAKDKRAKIHANIFQVFLALLTFLLGLIAEHFLEIVHVVLSLF